LNFGNTIVVVAANATMVDTLAFRSKLGGGKLFGGIDAIISAVGLNLYACCGCLTLKTEFGLDRFGPGKSNLVNHSELCTGGITEDSYPTEFLGGEMIAMGGELTTQKGRLVLIQKDQVTWFQFVYLQNSFGRVPDDS
jgi:hypothetical protein